MISVLLLGGCSQDSAPSAKANPTKVNDQTTNVPTVSGPAATADGTSLGQIKATELINLNALVARTPEQVEAVLGAPTDTGTDRSSCVRFLPERVFFACDQEVRVYEHPHFELIRIEYEDGYASVVALSGLPGEGAFDYEAALALVGIELPEKPFHDHPPLGMTGEANDEVDRWEWGNSSARLLVRSKEHRVRLSVVNKQWKRSKVEIILNHPLTAEQEAKIKLPRGEAIQTPVEDAALELTG